MSLPLLPRGMAWPAGAAREYGRRVLFVAREIGEGRIDSGLKGGKLHGFETHSIYLASARIPVSKASRLRFPCDSPGRGCNRARAFL
jgi:hypothetical protein